MVEETCLPAGRGLYFFYMRYNYIAYKKIYLSLIYANRFYR